jgi:hypothetical protein
VVGAGFGASEKWIALPGVSRDVHDRVRELAAAEPFRRYGVTPGEREVPVDRLAPRTWADLVSEMWSEAMGQR